MSKSFKSEVSNKSAAVSKAAESTKEIFFITHCVAEEFTRIFALFSALELSLFLENFTADYNIQV